MARLRPRAEVLGGRGESKVKGSIKGGTRSGAGRRDRCDSQNGMRNVFHNFVMLSTVRV